MTHLKLSDFTTLVKRRVENEMLLNVMLQSPHIDLASLVVLYQIHTLYNEDSSNAANINRIAINLEAIAADILNLSKNVRKLEYVRRVN